MQLLAITHEVASRISTACREALPPSKHPHTRMSDSSRPPLNGPLQLIGFMPSRSMCAFDWKRTSEHQRNTESIVFIGTLPVLENPARSTRHNAKRIAPQEKPKRSQGRPTLRTSYRGSKPQALRAANLRNTELSERGKRKTSATPGFPQHPTSPARRCSCLNYQDVCPQKERLCRGLVVVRRSPPDQSCLAPRHPCP